tara:strand:+ start:488 stop:1408 length:921 start_codon:yes stop_codon:yes gene_type:complete
LHADCIVSGLNDVGVPIIRLSPIDNFSEPFFLSSVKSELLIIGGSRVDVSNVTGVYCRVALERLSESFSPRDALERHSIEEEASAWLCGLLSISSYFWVNNPRYEIWADNKQFSLMIASRVGLCVPDFIITNSLSRAKHFSEGKQVVIKSISDTSLAFQRGKFLEVPDFNSFDAIGTSLFKVEEISPEAVDGTPFFLQAYVERIEEFRVTIIDESIFVAKAILSPNQIDIKDVVGLTYEKSDIASDDKNMLLKLMQQLGLRFCTFDLVRAKMGEIYLVDINPSGNWLWLNPLFDGRIANEIVSGLR